MPRIARPPISPWLGLATALIAVLVSASAGSQVVTYPNQQTRDNLLAGQPVHFDPGQTEAERTIPADWIAEAAKKSVRVDLEHAIIRGPLNLKYAELKEEFSLVLCDVEEPADFSYSSLKRNLILAGTRFHGGVDFDSATLEYNAIIDRAMFLGGKARFRDLRAHGFFSAVAAQFYPGVQANFVRARFEKSAFFTSTSFGDEVNFIATQVGTNAMFEGVQFNSADKPVSFNRADIKGNAFFTGARFAGEADFLGTHIGGSAGFIGALFKQKVIFNSAEIDGAAFFRAEPKRRIPAAAFEGGADFITVRIGGSAEFQGVAFNQWVSFNGARIGENAFFRAEPDRGLPAATFGGEVDFIGAQISGDADFNGVQFKSTDKPVSFDGAEIKGSALFAGAHFAGDARFVGAHIGGSAEFQGAVFKHWVTFNAAKIDGAVFFRPSPARKLPAAIFEGEADFASAQVGSNVEFIAVQFRGGDKPVSFSRAEIKGDAFFRGTQFTGPAAFVGTHIVGSADFQGAVFRKSVTFNRARIDEGVLFRAKPDEGLQAAGFEGEADFIDIQIGGQAAFPGAAFSKSTSFDNAQILGPAFFDKAQFIEGSEPSFVGARFHQGAFFQGATFADEVDFRTARFEVEARFDGATFARAARFEASSFLGVAHFSSTAKELPGTVFNEVSFNHSRFERDARFDNALFKGAASFRETSFRVAYFSSDGQAQGQEQFQDTLDLRGCTYDRIQVNWPSLRTKLEPYDRQPYTQVEKVLQSVGQDSAADEVYLERRAIERRQKYNRGQYGAWAWDWINWWAFNYGVRPYRLIIASLLLIALGTFVFSRRGAVQPAQPKGSSSPAPQCSRADPLSKRDAFRLSLRLFIPVPVPLATAWEPSDKPSLVKLRFSDLATLLILLGWILVPVGIAAFTGLLRRVVP